MLTVPNNREINAAEYGSAPDGPDLPPRIHVVLRRLSVRRPPARRACQIQRHLSLCDNCTQYLADYERTVGLERGAFEQGEALPPEVPESLVAAILASRSTATSTD